MRKIGIVGAAGRMGQMLLRTLSQTEGVAISGATERPGHDWIGRDIGAAMGLGRDLGVLVEDDPLEMFARSHAVIDFTSPAASVAHAGLAAQAKCALVIGSTGFEPEHLAAIKAAARHCPIVRAGNMSLGVNLLTVLTKKVAEALGEDWDVEIVEMHHNKKVDAPSGTALMLGQAAADGRGVDLETAKDSGRDGQTGAREKGKIGFAALRGGDVVGEHDVIFAAAGERIVLRHLATDRAIFARGAVRAAVWAVGRPSGEYAMTDVLGM